MKPLMVGICSLIVWATSVLPAPAAWNNVFQPTLFGRCRQKQAPVAARYAPPVLVQASPSVAYSPPPCNTCQSPPPGNNCTTSYTQRCFYQPITTYESKSYYEQVTTVQTSYYYEPVTSYRYSSYVDPCSGCTQQVAVPTTSYELRAKSCPVQSWVQRCAQVPVTSYQKSCYWQPQTTCCQTTIGALIPMDGSGAPPQGAPQGAPPQGALQGAPPQGALQGAPPQGALQGGFQGAPPQITPGFVPGQTNPPPSIKGEIQPGTNSYYFPPQSSWKPITGVPVQPTTNPPPPPAVKLENIVVGPESAGPEATVEGQVVRSDNTPRPNAKVLFVAAGTQGARQEVTANTAGRFQVTLASGSYHVYMQTGDGVTQYHSRVEVGGNQGARITLVNR